MGATADTGSAQSGWSVPDTSPLADPLEEHPELLVAGAFAGGMVLALALRWLGRDGDD
jgi:hypothetical protein